MAKLLIKMVGLGFSGLDVSFVENIELFPCLFFVYVFAGTLGKILVVDVAMVQQLQ